MLQPFYYTCKRSYRVLGTVSQRHPKVKGKFKSDRERDKKNPKEGILSVFWIRDSSENVFLEDLIPDACPINGEYH